MQIKKATLDDCYAIAELAMMAGEGIPAYFWELSRKPDQKNIDVGAANAASETENFSYRNVHIALIDGEVAGMLLAYRLPEQDVADDLQDYPEFIRPLIELEQCVPGSFYINMLATYPKFRNAGIGTKLMSIVDRLALEAGCEILSVEVFEQNAGALRLYQRLGYDIIDQRNVIAHPSHHYNGRVLLLTKRVST